MTETPKSVESRHNYLGIKQRLFPLAALRIFHGLKNAAPDSKLLPLRITRNHMLILINNLLLHDILKNIFNRNQPHHILDLLAIHKSVKPPQILPKLNPKKFPPYRVGLLFLDHILRVPGDHQNGSVLDLHAGQGLVGAVGLGDADGVD